ncbi:MAG TPA: sigma 54-interacting transcriptional regulator [Polyangia bacterium]|nr:sigma 54-interacting transcriptional regulator [Polyangia bacterium]
MLWSQAIPSASDQFKQLLLELAQERSLDDLLPLVTRRLAEHEDVALARLWLLERGDRCGSCRNLSACADHAACLHLVASAARDRRTHTVAATRLDGDFQRIPVGAFKVGAVAASGTAVLVADATNDPKIRRPDWVRQEGIASFAGLPLSSRGELLGVLGVFVRAPLSAAALDVLRIVANHAAAAIATARAFAQVDAMRRHLLVENQRLRQGVEPDALDDLLGTSEQLRAIRQQIAAVAATSATVLVLGESGTGKELAARAIHQRSQVGSGPFVELNCAAIPRELAESELFGHVRGAFSGATRDRVGRFEAAEGGTLFLDEIGELPLELQGKLLRVLQEGTYERVGEVRTRHARVRVIAATNRDLIAEVEAGRFRQDLYYRLAVYPITLPPLRHRREDVAALAPRLLERICRRLAHAPVTLTSEQLAELAARPWRGNVRELLNVLERAVISAQPGQPLVLPPADPPRDREAVPGTQAAPPPLAGRADVACVPALEGPPPGEPQVPPGVLPDLEMRRRERENVLRALERCGGRIYGPTGAAALLGMKPTTLASRIKRLRLFPRAAASSSR